MTLTATAQLSGPAQAQPASPKGSAKVGVIIPVYNRPQIVLDAIDCVMRQTVHPQRLVIVDDGSTDETATNIEKLLTETNPSFEVKLTRQSRGGVSAARNRAAMQLEDCDILAMIDSDDLWPSDYLEKMVQPLVDNTDVAATFCDQVFVNTRTGEQRHRDLSIYASDTTRRMFLYGPPTPSCTVVRGELFRKLGGYDQSLTCSEDYDLHLKLSLEGRWAHVPKLQVQIRRATGVTNETAHHLTELKDLYISTQRVLMLERFARELGGHRAMPWRAWRTSLSRAWVKQGRTMEAAAQPAQAAWCYTRAVREAVWLPSAWSGWIRVRRQARPMCPKAAMAHAEAML